MSLDRLRDAVDIQMIEWQVTLVFPNNGIGWTFNHLTELLKT